MMARTRTSSWKTSFYSHHFHMIVHFSAGPQFGRSANFGLCSWWCMASWNVCSQNVQSVYRKTSIFIMFYLELHVPCLWVEYVVLICAYNYSNMLLKPTEKGDIFRGNMLNPLPAVIVRPRSVSQQGDGPKQILGRYLEATDTSCIILHDHAPWFWQFSLSLYNCMYSISLTYIYIYIHTYIYNIYIYT